MKQNSFILRRLKLRLFNRKAELIVGKPGEKGRLIKDLRMSFTILKTDSKETNPAKIEIYNLNRDTRGIFEEEGSRVQLSVGYEGQDTLNTIFIGDILSFSPEYTGTDNIFTVICKDGYVALDQAKFTLGFDEGSTSRQILNSIITKLKSEFNLASATGENIPNLKYENGFSYVGKAQGILDKILSRVNHDWIIDNNNLIISPTGSTNETTFAQLLSKDTGMLGQPRRVKQQPVKSKGGRGKTFDGWVVRSLIIPGLNPKQRIVVNSEKEDLINREFLIKTSKYTGDTRGNAWEVEMEVTEGG